MDARDRAAVLSGRPAGSVREGGCRSGCGDSGPRGRCRPGRQGGRPGVAVAVPTGPGDHDRPAEPRPDRGIRRDLAAVAQTPAIARSCWPRRRGPATWHHWVDLRVIALCESPLGIRNAGPLADLPCVIGLMWGAEDLVAGLGGSSSRRTDGRYRDFARHARSTRADRRRQRRQGRLRRRPSGHRRRCRPVRGGAGRRRLRFRRNGVHPSTAGRDHPVGVPPVRGDARAGRRSVLAAAEAAGMACSPTAAG